MIRRQPAVNDKLQGGGQIPATGAGIQQKSPVGPEQDEHERLLEIGAAGLPQDVQVRVVLVDR